VKQEDAKAMHGIKFAAVAVIAGLLSACATDSGPKQGFGTILGGVGGAVAGAQLGKGKGQLVGVAAGTLLGAMIGNEIGKSLDRADQMAMDRAGQQAAAAPIGQRIAWSNPDSGNSGYVVPTREGTGPRGEYCREYQQTVTVGGKTEQAYGTACRQPDGSWKVVN
jgi:surface antigen